MIVAPIFGMHFLFTGNYDIMISEREYSDLSSISIQLLHEKETIINNIFPKLPYIICLLMVIGFCCIIWGGFKWYRIQTTLDENIVLDVWKKRINYEKLSATEVVEKVISENSECQDEIGNYSISKGNQRIINYIQIENAYYDYLNKKLKPRYDVQQNVRMGNYVYDIIAISKTRSTTDFLYEIKYLEFSSLSYRNLKSSLSQISGAATNYEKTTNRNAVSKLVIVSKRENIELMKNQIDEKLDEINKNILINCEIKFLSEEELLS